MELKNVSQPISDEKLREWHKIFSNRGMKAAFFKQSRMSRNTYYTIIKKKRATRRIVADIDGFITRLKENS